MISIKKELANSLDYVTIEDVRIFSKAKARKCDNICFMY